MPADALRLFVFARHAESTANAADVLSTSPSRRVALTALGRAQARALGAQLAGLHVDLAVGTRLLRTQETIGIALHGRPVPTLIEPGFDEIRAGDLDGARIDTYRSWRDRHTAGDRLPHGESTDDTLRRYAAALRRLLARKEEVTLVVIHEIAPPPAPRPGATPPSRTRPRTSSTRPPSAAPRPAWPRRTLTAQPPAVSAAYPARQHSRAVARALGVAWPVRQPGVHCRS
jgi:hypothetical protein